MTSTGRGRSDSGPPYHQTPSFRPLHHIYYPDAFSRAMSEPHYPFEQRMLLQPSPPPRPNFTSFPVPPPRPQLRHDYSSHTYTESPFSNIYSPSTNYEAPLYSPVSASWTYIHNSSNSSSINPIDTTYGSDPYLDILLRRRSSGLSSVDTRGGSFGTSFFTRGTFEPDLFTAPSSVSTSSSVGIMSQAMPGLAPVAVSESSSRSSRRGSVDSLLPIRLGTTQFINKLYWILGAEGFKQYGDTLRWTSSGESILFDFSSCRLTTEVLPFLFNHSSLTAFTRQLNIYSFTQSSVADIIEIIQQLPQEVRNRDWRCYALKNFVQKDDTQLYLLKPRPSAARRKETIRRSTEIGIGSDGGASVTGEAESQGSDD